MRAILLKQDGYSGQSTGPVISDAALYLETADIPKPVPADGQVLIRLRAASVNPSDLHFIKGEYGQPRVKGAPAGFEGCGDVVETGAGAEGLSGKRVAFAVSQNGSGAWAEYAVTDAMNCIPLRDDISDEDGAAQIVNPMTAMAMVHMAAADGEAFVISAAGSQLGKLMIGLARDMGLQAIALVRRAETVAPLTALGAAAVLDVTAPDFAEQFADASRRYKPRVFLDAVSDRISERVFTLMPNRARWVSYGKLGTDTPCLSEMGQLIFMGKRIEGFWLTQWMRTTAPAEQMQAVAEVQARFADGRWRTDVAKRLELAEVETGLAAATKLPDGKVIIVP